MEVKGPRVQDNHQSDIKLLTLTFHYVLRLPAYPIHMIQIEINDLNGLFSILFNIFLVTTNDVDAEDGVSLILSWREAQ